MDIIISCIGVAIISCVLGALVKKTAQPMAILITFSAVTAIFLLIASEITALISFITELSRRAGLDYAIFQPLFKVTVIAVCIRITAELCRDNDEGAIAAKIELAGSVACALCAVPLLEQVLTLIGAL